MTGLMLILAGLNGLAMVAMGAIGAHALPSGAAAAAAVPFQSGWQIHGLHAALLAALALHAPESRWLRAAFWLGLLGTLLFSGSIYGLALGWWSGGRFVTPMGGSVLMLAWLALAGAGLGRLRARAP
ncbi:MAG: DUF423 domain-containing protein [Alphaproteobacteria bacterium]|nr:DUF423 domain-containing protein [Alphaproteobacteria bacterium]MCB9928415.1 DUF423 domain-containing protein [Alphaproteobacteria bacterium]